MICCARAVSSRCCGLTHICVHLRQCRAISDQAATSAVVHVVRRTRRAGGAVRRSRRFIRRGVTKRNQAQSRGGGVVKGEGTKPRMLCHHQLPADAREETQSQPEFCGWLLRQRSLALPPVPPYHRPPGRYERSLFVLVLPRTRLSYAGHHAAPSLSGLACTAAASPK